MLERGSLALRGVLARSTCDPWILVYVPALDPGQGSPTANTLPTRHWPFCSSIPEVHVRV